MNNLLSTGQVARLLITTEPRLADFVRKGKIHPRPPIAAGRRQWDPCQVFQAGDLLGIPAEEVSERLDTFDFRTEAAH